MSKSNKKITKLSDLNQMDAKIHDENSAPSTLEDIIGSTYFNRYNGESKENYEGKINGMNVAELRSHAITLGFVPNSNRERLVKQLLSEFNKYTLNFKRPAHTDSNVSLSNKQRDAALSIMRGAK